LIVIENDCWPMMVVAPRSRFFLRLPALDFAFFLRIWCEHVQPLRRKSNNCLVRVHCHRWQRRRCEISREKFGSVFCLYLVHSVCRFFSTSGHDHHSPRAWSLARSASTQISLYSGSIPFVPFTESFDRIGGLIQSVACNRRGEPARPINVTRRGQLAVRAVPANCA